MESRLTNLIPEFIMRTFGLNSQLIGNQLVIEFKQIRILIDIKNLTCKDIRAVIQKSIENPYCPICRENCSSKELCANQSYICPNRKCGVNYCARCIGKLLAEGNYKCSGCREFLISEEMRQRIDYVLRNYSPEAIFSEFVNKNKCI